MSVSVRLARSKEEFEQAYRLLKNAEAPQSPGSIWLLKQHALPSTNTIVALEAGQVIGAVTVFGESAFPLPLEEQVNLKKFRESLSGRIAEISYAAVAELRTDLRDIRLALYYFATCFGSTYCLYDVFLTKFPGNREDARTMGLASFHGSSDVWFCPATECPDLRRAFSAGFSADFQFPEKNTFLVAHQNIDRDTLDYLFNEKTGLFDRLSDFDLRVLKNYYDHRHFSSLLPGRPLQLPFKTEPKYRRFPMNCEGFLCGGNGQKIHLQVLDVSKEGIKIRSEDPLATGTYPLTLAIGVVKRAEVIATTVWIDPDTRIAGLHVTSGDKNWEKLVSYLESESLKPAA